jgi:hypothetical protein
MLRAFLPADMPEQVQDRFAYGVIEALDCLRRQQSARWQN